MINGNSEMINVITLNLFFFILYYLISFRPKHLIETYSARADMITAHGIKGNSDIVLPVLSVSLVKNPKRRDVFSIVALCVSAFFGFLMFGILAFGLIATFM